MRSERSVALGLKASVSTSSNEMRRATEAKYSLTWTVLSKRDVARIVAALMEEKCAAR